METNEVFRYAIVGAILVAAAAPLIGILFTSGKPKRMGGANTPKKPEAPPHKKEPAYTH